MDRHVKSSKEVLAWIAAQRRVTSISSVIIALLLMFLIGILLYLVNLSILEKEIPQQVTYIAPPSDEIDDDASQKKSADSNCAPPNPTGRRGTLENHLCHYDLSRCGAHDGRAHSRSKLWDRRGLW